MQYASLLPPSYQEDQYKKWLANPNDPEFANYPTSTITQYQSRKQADQNEQYAQGLQNQANQFSANLPSYIAPQAQSAQEQARNDLTNQLYGIKQNANARGLLFSGVNENNQNMMKAEESGNLAKELQGINQGAYNLRDQEQQMAAQAFSNAGAQTANFAQMESQNSQQIYQQALESAQQQTQFYQNLVSGVVGTAGSAAAALA